MQLKKPIWIIGIHTDVGKTTVSGLVARALRADYWKPVQAGSLDRTDSHRAGDMLQNTASVVHPEAHCFIHAMSPGSQHPANAPNFC
jgi:dethiobiotin synthetase